MLIETLYNGIEIHREDKIIYAKFLLPHQVISTCRVFGGLRDDMGYIYNHQSCEPAGHSHRMTQKAISDPKGYRRMISEKHGLPADTCVTLGTAANMNNAWTLKPFAISVLRLFAQVVWKATPGGSVIRLRLLRQTMALKDWTHLRLCRKPAPLIP